MAKPASDYRVYGTTNMDVVDDATTVGGAMSIANGVNMVGDPAYPATETQEAVSSNAGDTTVSLTTWGYTTDGRINNASPMSVTTGGSGTGNLTGTTAVTLPNSPLFRLLKATISAGTLGLITIRKVAAGGDRATIAADTLVNGLRELSAYRLFIGAYADPVSSIIRYNKVFWTNTNVSGSNLTGVAPVYRLTADPQAKIRVGVHTSTNDSATITNRLTAPAGVTFVDDNVDQSGSDLVVNDRQGVWIEFTSPAAGTGFQDNFTLQITAGSI